MRYELFIGLRYLRARRKQVFISIITLISIAGVALGVSALIITLSVMNGFRKDLRQKIVGVNAHIIILDQRDIGLESEEVNKVQRKIKKIKSVISSAPFVYGQIMLKSGKRISGAVIKGIIPNESTKVTDIQKYLIQGDLGKLEESKDASKWGIVLGKELAKNLGVFLGKDVLLFSPSEMAGHLGMMPVIRKFQVVGIFDSGMYEYDANLAYVSLSNAQRLFNLDEKITGIEVKIRDFSKAGKIARTIQRILGYPYLARSWMSANRNLFAALKLEKITMSIILVLIVLVAAFNIISTLMMMTMEKTTDIGILKAMGASKRSIMKIFMIEGLVIGLIGMFVGLGIGYGACSLLGKYQFIKLPQDVYYIDALPVQMQINDFLFIGLAAVLISFFATLYPSYKASQLNPCEAIRYE
ncbi:lipoprotein-releasing ABC transporter permease subunit [bacterium]|nr:lipoprotein-releasing ABC transporter permease subunit [bacterium]